ncbi:hypothetical protein M758_6G028500 [Ceratodon purpureus]|nr:hypothetical protein M758_6G028500 [Ceratodon purpureus]
MQHLRALDCVLRRRLSLLSPLVFSLLLASPPLPVSSFVLFQLDVHLGGYKTTIQPCKEQAGDVRLRPQ